MRGELLKLFKDEVEEEYSYCNICMGQGAGIEYMMCCGFANHRECFTKNQGSGITYAIPGAQALCPYCSFGPTGLIKKRYNSIHSIKTLAGYEYDPQKESNLWSERIATATKATGVLNIHNLDLYQDMIDDGRVKIPEKNDHMNRIQKMPVLVTPKEDRIPYEDGDSHIDNYNVLREQYP